MRETGVFIYLLVVPITGHSLLIIIENHVQGHDFTGIRKQENTPKFFQRPERAARWCSEVQILLTKKET